MKLRRVFGDYAILLAGTIAGRLVALLSGTLLARHLGAEGLGKFGTGITLIGYLLLVSNLGLDSIGTRLVAGKASRAWPVAARVRVVRLTVAALLGALALIVVKWTNGPLAFALPLAFLGATLAFRDDWLLLALGRSRAVATASFVREAVYLVLIALIVTRSPSPVMAAWVYLGADAVWAIAIQIMLRGRDSRANNEPSPRIGSLVRSGVPIAVMGLMTLTYTKIDTPLLAAMKGAREAGVYFAAYGIVFAVQAVLTPLTRAAIPEMAKVEAGGANASLAGMFRLSRLATSFSGLLAAGILVGADSILGLLYGEGYARGAVPLRLLAWSIPFTASYCILQQGLIIQDRHQRFALLGGMAAVTNVCLNVCLIPAYGIGGAAVATIASELVLFLGTTSLYGTHPQAKRLAFRLAMVLLALSGLGVTLNLLEMNPALLRAVIALICFGVIALVGYAFEKRMEHNHIWDWGS